MLLKMGLLRIFFNGSVLQGTALYIVSWSHSCLTIKAFHGIFWFQVWQLGSSSPNFTLEGHEKGVNCIDYYSGGDKPYLISGADDRQVKIWDYQV